MTQPYKICFFFRIILLGKALVDLFGNVGEFTAKIGAWTLGVGEPSVHCKISLCVTCEIKTLDAVALANVNAKLDKASHSNLAYVPFSADFVIRYLDSYSAVIVWTVRGAPGAILFLNVHSYSALRVDSVV